MTPPMTSYLQSISLRVFQTRKMRGERLAIGWQARALASQPIANRPPRLCVYELVVLTNAVDSKAIGLELHLHLQFVSIT